MAPREGERDNGGMVDRWLVVRCKDGRVMGDYENRASAEVLVRDLNADPDDDSLYILADAAPSSGGEVTGAMRLLAAERERQKSVAGWTAEHDDEHSDESLAIVASQYARPERLREVRNTLSPPHFQMPSPWPDSWSRDWWKPTPDDRVRELVKAGALIVAEIERLLRARSGGGAP